VGVCVCVSSMFVCFGYLLSEEETSGTGSVKLPPLCVCVCVCACVYVRVRVRCVYVYVCFSLPALCSPPTFVTPRWGRGVLGCMHARIYAHAHMHIG